METITLEVVLGQAIAYLGYILVLAGAVQTAISTIKPAFITPIREWLEEQGYERFYLPLFYAFRLAVSVAGFYGVWGGVDAVREVVSISFIPDSGIAFVTIFLVVMGQEVIHPIIDRLYILQDAIEGIEIDLIENPPPPETNDDDEETGQPVG